LVALVLILLGAIVTVFFSSWVNVFIDNVSSLNKAHAHSLTLHSYVSTELLFILFLMLQKSRMHVRQNLTCFFH
jgi:hypothetical protein